MVCNACGRLTQNEEANYCEYCGNSFREHINVAVKPEPPKYITAITENTDKPVPFLNWLGTYALLFIPYIGGFAFVGLLIFWSLSGSTPQSKKNWARATLIFTIISFIILIIAFMSFFSNPAFMDYMNGTIGMNELFESVY
ncbi:hypothetical protein I5677_12400 [Mobilitalea sibirica]|uniref:Uncharacterized protein n=1 Tax=Mobilitalea sibirica TaxID=1462919 RepID=A0A8J7H058_9FIRM|nr:hypothetical protein [Mobilitalea sibirica]MBH1941694.1 hypothetical protein [Mobilitalea sibirica]